METTELRNKRGHIRIGRTTAAAFFLCHGVTWYLILTARRMKYSNGQATQCAKPRLFCIIAIKELAFQTRTTKRSEAGLEEHRTGDKEVINPLSCTRCSASLSVPAWHGSKTTHKQWKALSHFSHLPF